MENVKENVSNFDLKEYILKPVIPTLIAILVVVVLLGEPLQRSLKAGWQELTDLVTVEVHRLAEGETTQYGNTFPVVNRGDRIIVRVPLERDRMVKNAMLGFNIPHVFGHARVGDEVLWSYGEDMIAQGKFVGNLFFLVPLRDDMWGSTLELHLTVMEQAAFSSIVNVQAMPEQSSFRYYFSQFQLEIFAFLGSLCVATMAFVIFLFYRRKSDLHREGMFLAAFCALLSGWFLASRGLPYVFTNNIRFCAHAEYMAIYLMPIPFCLFMSLQVKRDRRYRAFSDAMAIFFSLVAVAVTILNYTTAKYHYITFLLPLQVCMLLTVLIFVAMLVRKQYAEDLSSKIIRHGVAISMMILMLELVRYNVSKYGMLMLDLEKVSFASAGMLTFAGTLTLGYLARILDAMSEHSDKALLLRLAYVDVLTGISNRAYCTQKVEEMDKEGETQFALIFFDLNGLKWANDQYGHEMGDALICSVATGLQKVFGQQKFCGRWGGDEFVVCLTGASVRYADTMVRDFEQEIKTINEIENFPFPVSVAYGMVRSTELETVSVEEAIREADRRMYVKKTRMRKEENIPESVR